MILTPDLLFIHIPKTAGMSCTDFLCEHLRGPIAYFSIKADLGTSTYRNAQVFPGFNHETLEEIYADRERMLNLSGMDVRKVSKILTIIRHPYDLELSTYLFFRNGHNNYLQVFKDSPNIAERIALAQCSFREFVVQSGYFRKESETSIGGRPYRMEDYFLLNGEMPPNVQILKFECLAESLPSAVRAFCASDFQDGFPHSNRSLGERQRMTVEIDDDVKALIIEKHQWVFEHSYYQP